MRADQLLKCRDLPGARIIRTVHEQVGDIGEAVGTPDVLQRPRSVARQRILAEAKRPEELIRLDLDDSGDIGVFDLDLLLESLVQLLADGRDRLADSAGLFAGVEQLGGDGRDPLTALVVGERAADAFEDQVWSGGSLEDPEFLYTIQEPGVGDLTQGSTRSVHVTSPTTAPTGGRGGGRRRSAGCRRGWGLRW